MKSMRRLTFIGLSLLLSVCLFTVPPAFAQLKLETLTGLWLFDEGSGNMAADSSDSALDATIEGSPSWVNGVFGSGLIRWWAMLVFTRHLSSNLT